MVWKHLEAPEEEGPMEQRWERCAELDVLSGSVTASVQMAGPSQQGTQHFQTCGTTAADFLPLGLPGWPPELHTSPLRARGWDGAVFYILKESCTHLLINAAHRRQKPGRKTDAADCAWLAQLLKPGLACGRGVPPPTIRTKDSVLATRGPRGLHFGGTRRKFSLSPTLFFGLHTSSAHASCFIATRTLIVSSACMRSERHGEPSTYSDGMRTGSSWRVLASNDAPSVSDFLTRGMLDPGRPEKT